MVAKTIRWVDSLFALTALRIVVWFSLAVGAYPGVLRNPYKLANWFDDHALYAFEEVDRITLLRYHQLPAWNPYWCGGASGIAEPEDSLYSPDFLLRLIFGVEHGRRLALVLFFVLGFEGMYRLCRRLDSSAVAATLGAIVFATCDRFLSFIHDGWVHFMSFELIPWVLLALLNGVESVRWRVIGGMFLAWIVLAPGTYPTPYTAVAFAYCFLVIVFCRFFRAERAPFRGPILSALTIGGVAFLLCFCKLVPTTLYMAQFPRIFTPVETHTMMEMLGGFVPQYSFVVLLVIVGVMFGDVAAGVCVGGALLFFALSMGDFGPTSPFHLMKKVPLLSQLRFPDRFIVMVVLFVAVAASRGLTRLEDALPRFVSAAWRWAGTLPLKSLAERVTRREIRWLDPPSVSEVPRVLLWFAVGLAAYFSFRIAGPYAQELAVSQSAASLSLYVEEAPRTFAQDFKQHRGNRRDAHIFPAINMGSMYCVVGIPVPESGRLRADLPAEEYPADPALADVRRVSWSPNSIVLDVNAKAPTTIFVNQNWAPQWRSDVGKVRSEEGMLAVDVPAGRRTLRIDYRDNVLYFSLLVSLGTLLVIAWFGGGLLVRRIRREWDGFDALPLLPSPSLGRTPERVLDVVPDEKRERRQEAQDGDPDPER